MLGNGSWRMAKKRPWKLIDGKLYQFKCYRSDYFAANNKIRDLTWQENFECQRINNEELNRFDIYVRPK